MKNSVSTLKMKENNINCIIITIKKIILIDMSFYALNNFNYYD